MAGKDDAVGERGGGEEPGGGPRKTLPGDPNKVSSLSSTCDCECDKTSKHWHPGHPHTEHFMHPIKPSKAVCMTYN